MSKKYCARGQKKTVGGVSEIYLAQFGLIDVHPLFSWRRSTQKLERTIERGSVDGSSAWEALLLSQKGKKTPTDRYRQRRPPSRTADPTHPTDRAWPRKGGSSGLDSAFFFLYSAVVVGLGSHDRYIRSVPRSNGTQSAWESCPGIVWLRGRFPWLYDSMFNSRHS